MHFATYVDVRRGFECRRRSTSAAGGGAWAGASVAPQFLTAVTRPQRKVAAPPASTVAPRRAWCIPSHALRSSGAVPVPRGRHLRHRSSKLLRPRQMTWSMPLSTDWVLIRKHNAALWPSARLRGVLRPSCWSTSLCRSTTIRTRTLSLSFYQCRGPSTRLLVARHVRLVVARGGRRRAPLWSWRTRKRRQCLGLRAALLARLKHEPCSIGSHLRARQPRRSWRRTDFSLARGCSPVGVCCISGAGGRALQHSYPSL